MSADPSVRALAAHEADTCIEALADVLVDCVEGGASVGFMAPLPRGKALDYWRSVVAGVARGERMLLVAEAADGRLLGTVQLVTALPENQPHRADVAKMLVRRDARRQGIAAKLLQALDEAAKQAGKSLLVLDTVTGGDGERVYARAGWQKAGVVPNYALMPDGAFCATSFFYKPL